MTFYVYIVECQDGTLYTGYTTNLSDRIRAHNGEIAGGARYTSGRRPVVLRYVETYDVSTLAKQREYTIKQLTTPQKRTLITTNPYHPV